MKLALGASIHQFNVESEPELEALNEVALSLEHARADHHSRQSRMWMRKRTPRSPPAHPKPNSASLGNARATPMRWPPNSKASRSSASMCISAARSRSLRRFEAAFARVVEMVRHACAPMAMRFRASILAADWACPIATTTNRRPIPPHMARWLRSVTKGVGAQLIFEPGRLIAANAGVLVSEVLYVKHGEAKTVPHPRCRHERSHPARAI